MLYETLKLLGAGCCGAIVGAFAQHYFAERRTRKAAASEWHKELVGFVARFKTEYRRCDDPTGRYSCFNGSIRELSGLAAQAPQSMSATKRDGVTAIVAGLTRLTDQDVISRSEQVIKMLEKLEALARDT